MPADVQQNLRFITPAGVLDVLVLVIATSGRFTSDAVSWIEKHNNGSGRPLIEMWAEGHLEAHLAQRLHLVADRFARNQASA